MTGKITEYHYDLTDNIHEVWDNSKKIAEYEYNADNTIKCLKNGNLYTEYTYDADRNLTGLKTLLGTDTIVDNQYTYNGNGDRLEKYQKYGTTKYSYDKMRRLAKVEYPDATETLFYDNAGNRTKRLYNGIEELYQYDKRNRLTAYTKGTVTSQYAYDKAGNLLKDDKARYEYDAFNRNIKVETFNGNIQIKRYDAEGLRHEIEENGKLVTFIYRGDEVITEESKEDKIRYIRISVLLASDAESARTYYHYASDEMGSITHIVDSENKEILNHYEYDAWGNLTSCEEKVQNRFRFNGQQYDPISQQYYLRARYYNPVIGRFTQEDTYNVDGLNLYVYCRNNPVSYVDPSGNICDSAAETIRRKIMTNQATLNERKKYEAYIRNKARNGIELSDKQIHAYQESLSSRNAHKPGTGIIPYDAGLAARQMPPVEIRFGPANLTGKGYDAFVSHLREQQNELNRLSLYYTSDLELNLFLFHNDPNMVVHDANDKARRNARVYLGKGSGDVAHALDACAGGYLNNIPNRRPSRPQQQVGVGWKTNWTQIVPGRRHILITEPQGYVKPKSK